MHRMVLATAAVAVVFVTGLSGSATAEDGGGWVGGGGRAVTATAGGSGG